MNGIIPGARRVGQYGASGDPVKLLPFGLGETKPTHFRTMLRVLWDNRDNLEYAWRVLNRGVCDGCALGTSGLSDWTLDGGTHLCVVRLELLRLNTMPALDHRRLADVAALRANDDRALRALGRLPYPLRRDHGDAGFRRVSWDEALDLAAGRVRATDPDRLCLFLTSRGVTNEVYYVGQKVARFLGSPHVENSARLCHAPSTVGMKATIGVAASTVSYKDWIGTDLLVFFGTNFANDQPVATKYVDLARKAGAKVLAVNSYREPGLTRYWIPSTPESALFGTALVDRFFQVHQGGDLAFFCAVMKTLIAKGGVERAFVDAHTTGYDDLARALEAQVMPDLLRLAGSTAEDVDAFAAALMAAKNAVFVWSMGLTQHAHGAETIKGLVDLALLRGYLGRPHAGVVPIRGHSGVQGGAEMGAYATALPGGLPVTAEHAARFSALWGFDVPARPGRSTPEMLAAAGRGEVDVFYCVGGNFLGTMPRPALVAEALGRVPLRVHQDIVVNTSMLVDPPPGGTVLLLPARTRYEQPGGGTETTTERRVVFSPYIPGHDVGEARSEWEILQEVAARAHPERAHLIRFASGQAVRDEIARAVPAYAGIERLRRKGDQFQWGGPRLCEGGVFPLPGGKARLAPVKPPELAVPEGHLRLATRRGKQFNSIVWADADPLNDARREDVLMAPEDLERLGLRDGDRIVLDNDLGRFEGRAKAAPIRPGNVQGHWPEVNVLIPADRVDPYAQVPDYNALVRVRRA
ncbi:MAG: FdhF/YdeP family oxidoreductase [Planctomycetota bacterium]|nr:FdhF/YdeP family oxidoreductase [Planctomycetota bacterium]